MRPCKECCPPIAYTLTAVPLKNVAPTSPPPKKHLPQFNKGSYGTTTVPIFFNMKGLCYLAGNICVKLQISLYF